MLLFVDRWRDSIVVSMTPFRIVEQLYVFKNCLARVLARLILTPPHFFFLLVCKETFRHRVVMAIASTAHARFDVERFK